LTNLDIENLIRTIYENFKGGSGLQDLETYLNNVYGIWDDNIYFPIEQICSHTEKNKIIKDLLKFRLGQL
jgi:hypothetical protein